MYWSPPATGPPAPSLNGSSIFSSAPPFLSSSDAGPDEHDALLGVFSLLFPGDADPGKEVVAGRCVLVEALVAVGP